MKDKISGANASKDELGICNLNKCLKENYVFKNGNAIQLIHSDLKIFLKRKYIIKLSNISDVSPKNLQLLDILNNLSSQYNGIMALIKDEFKAEMECKKNNDKILKNTGEIETVIQDINSYFKVPTFSLDYENDKIYMIDKRRKTLCDNEVKTLLVNLSKYTGDDNLSDYRIKLKAVLKKIYNMKNFKSKFIYSPYLVEDENIRFGDNKLLKYDDVIDSLKKINEHFISNGFKIDGNDFVVGADKTKISKEDIYSVINFNIEKNKNEFPSFLAEILNKYDKTLIKNLKPITNKMFQNKVIKLVEKENKKINKLLDTIKKLSTRDKEFIITNKKIFQEINSKRLTELINYPMIKGEESLFYLDKFEYKNNFYTMKVSGVKGNKGYEVSKSKINTLINYDVLSLIATNINHILVLEDFFELCSSSTHEIYVDIKNNIYNELEDECIIGLFMDYFTEFNSLYLSQNVSLDLKSEEHIEKIFSYKQSIKVPIIDLKKKRTIKNILKTINSDFKEKTLVDYKNAYDLAMKKYEVIKEKIRILKVPSNAAVFNLVDKFRGRGITTLTDILYGSKSKKIISGGYTECCLHGCLSYMKKDEITNKISYLYRNNILNTDWIKGDYVSFNGYYVNSEYMMPFKSNIEILEGIKKEMEEYKNKKNIPAAKDRCIEITDIKKLLNLSTVDCELKNYILISKITEINMNDIKLIAEAANENKTFYRNNWEYISSCVPKFSNEQLTFLKLKVNLSNSQGYKATLKEIIKIEENKIDEKDRVING